MAAPGGIAWGGEVNAKGRLGLYVTASNTDTATTVNVEVWFWSRYSCLDNSNILYFNDGGTTANVSRGSVSISTTVNNSWNTANQVKIGTYSYTYSRDTAEKTIYCAARLINIDWVGAPMTVYASYRIPARASYPITYNANGGSGAPGNQAKWYGISLNLSTTKPTRTGYTFKGWATSASGGVVYASGATYTNNAALALYAVWQANSYTVSYNANGGSGAPGNQTKTHGIALALSEVIPTRTNYTFLGWGISALATMADYAPGASYTGNAAITLYAVWELAYIKPTITDFTADRCAADGAMDDYGTYLKVAFSWSCDQNMGVNTVRTIAIKHRAAASTEWTTTTVTASGTSGNISQVIGGGNVSADSAYDVSVSVTDSLNGVTVLARVVSGATFPIDFLAGGHGVAFGKPATIENAIDSNWTIYDKFGTMIGNGLAACSDSGIDPDTTTEHLVLTDVNTPMGGSGHFMYIQTLFNSTKSATANRMQIAVPYGSLGSMYHRYYVDGTWSDWRRHVNEDEIKDNYLPHNQTNTYNTDFNSLLSAQVVQVLFPAGVSQAAYHTPLGGTSSDTTISWYTVLVLGRSNRLTQIAFLPFDHQQTMYIRFRHDSNWSSWKKII